MINITILGSAGPVASSKRDNTFLLLNIGNQQFLIDCGGSPAYKLSKNKIDWKNIKTVILTHSHVDHIYGLPSFLHSLWICKSDRIVGNLKVIAPIKTIKRVKQLIDCFELMSKENMVKIDFLEINKNVDKIIDNSIVEIVTFPVYHGIEDTIGLHIIDKNTRKKVVYSSDTSFCENVSNYSEKAELLIHDCSVKIKRNNSGHASPVDVANIAENAGVKNLLLIHLDVETDQEERALVKEVSKYYSGNIRVATDFMKLDV